MQHQLKLTRSLIYNPKSYCNEKYMRFYYVVTIKHVEYCVEIINFLHFVFLTMQLRKTVYISTLSNFQLDISGRKRLIIML